MLDVYFDPNYGKLYEKCENGTAVFWKYEGEEGVVYHQFIRREIPIEAEGGPWYDIVTPYGYGGPLMVEVKEGFTREQLSQGFEKAFQAYCLENRIVAEFVRFHMLEPNAKDFEQVYHPVLNRYTVGTNLRDFDDPVASEFSKSCRKTCRQVISRGVTWTMTEKPDDISDFKEIYYSTMDRNDAGEYYYFDDEYFADIQKYFHDQLLLIRAEYEGKTIAAGLYFASNKVIHAHLSGTLSEYIHLSPAYVLKYATAVWGKEHGYEFIHYGGGRSSSPEDPLYVFKKKFGAHTEFPFYLGKRVWNDEAYDLLCRTAQREKDTEFFPAYRAPQHG